MPTCEYCGDPIVECCCGRTEVRSEEKIVCPCCGKAVEDTNYMAKGNTTVFCGSCRKTFSLTVRVVRTFISKSIEKEKMEI